MNRFALTFFWDRIWQFSFCCAFGSMGKDSVSPYLSKTPSRDVWYIYCADIGQMDAIYIIV